MAYKYLHFIPENTAPKGAKRIGVYSDKGRKVGHIPLGSLLQPKKKKLYSFGLISDVHFSHIGANWNPEDKLENALSYFEENDCKFCAMCGDISYEGFYKNNSGTLVEDYSVVSQYKEVCDRHTIPVYEVSGNHDGNHKSLLNDLDKWKAYTGNDTLSYTVTQGDDLFIFCGQPDYNSVMSDADLTWLGKVLKENKNRRCFVFIHSYIEEDSGDPTDLREHSLFEPWGTDNTNTFLKLLKDHGKVILCHGHSHVKFELQELDPCANYTDKNGFKSVHVPSLSRPRDINLSSNTHVEIGTEGQGYLVDVYTDCIVLNGMDFVNNRPISLGTYKILTPI